MSQSIMKFHINRTSEFLRKQPCEEAHQEEITYIDWRNVKTLDEARLPEYKHWADDFFAAGTNHREENGMVARDCPPQPIWVIELDSLASLVRLVDKYGEIVVYPENAWRGISHTIEIYDDYRE